jgi:hypothetical protein
VVEAEEPVFGVEDHADHVEADRAGSWPDVLLLLQPCGGESTQTGALTRAQPRQRLWVGANALLLHVYAACLDLREHKRVSVESNQGDLAVTDTFVTVQWGKPKPVKMGSDKLFAETV